MLLLPEFGEIGVAGQHSGQSGEDDKRTAGVTEGESEILRKALDLLLAREGIGENEDPFADLIGLFAGPSEVDHDDIYR